MSSLKIVMAGGVLAAWLNRSVSRATDFECGYNRQADHEWKEEWDGMPALSSAGDKAVRHILFIRHGQYTMHGGEDRLEKLTDLGRRQARELGRYLYDLANHLDLAPTHVCHSGMTRARETCQIAWGEVPNELKLKHLVSVKTEPALREIDPCPGDESTSKVVDFYRSERKTAARAVLDRFAAVHFRRPTENRSTLELYFCHSNVIRYLTLKLLQLPTNSWRNLALMHCSVTHIVIGGNGHVTCRALGDAGHNADRSTVTSHNVRA